jgi:hypothetical protein
MGRSNFLAGFVDHLHSPQRLMMQAAVSARPLDPLCRQADPTVEETANPMGVRRLADWIDGIL